MDNAGRRGSRFRRSRVAASLAQHAVAGIVPGDHVCASFGSDEEHQAIVGRYARQALRRGERLLYFLHSSDDATIRRYLELAGIDVEAGIALGQIELRPVEHDRSTIDPEAIIASLQADRRGALRDGYSALCACCGPQASASPTSRAAARWCGRRRRSGTGAGCCCPTPRRRSCGC